MNTLRLAALFAFTLASASAAPRPNVVMILADDQGWGDLSVSGNTNLHTPNIDSLARDGTKFDRFYVCPVCSPTRAEMLTGRYHPRTGVHGVSTGQERLNTDEKTIADAFKAAGYATGAFGKWHNGSQWPYHPNARGFDEFYGFTSGHWGEYFDPPLEHNGQPVRDKGFIADLFTDHAIAFIEKNKDKPFFCYLPFNTPHTPFAVPPEYWERFKNKDIKMRARPGDDEILDETRCVLASCENIDWNVGRVLKRLDDLKLADNTIVIYFSDNGPAMWRWNGGMKGKKGGTDEGGVRVPFFIRWPGHVPAGGRLGMLTGAIDLLPTLCAMTGVPRVGDKPLDGFDFSAFALGQRDLIPLPMIDRMIFSAWGSNVSVRTEWYLLDNQGALFDMEDDPGQRQDVAQKNNYYRETATKLRDAVLAWKKEMSGSAALDPKKGGNNYNDGADRPFTVGYPDFPRTPLPARDGVAHGTVKRSAPAPNSSYFVNWTTKDDSITWEIDVHTSGDYTVEIPYTCREGDEGSVVELSFNKNKLTGKVGPAWNPPLYTNQDTIPRHKAESQMKEFHTLSLGTMHLDAGKGTLTLRALEIPGKSVMDVRAVFLTLRQ